MSLAWTMRRRSDGVDLLCPDDVDTDDKLVRAAVVALCVAPLPGAIDREVLATAGRVDGVRFRDCTVEDLPAIVEVLHGAGCTLQSS